MAGRAHQINVSNGDVPKLAGVRFGVIGGQTPELGLPGRRHLSAGVGDLVGDGGGVPAAAAIEDYLVWDDGRAGSLDPGPRHRGGHR